MSSQRLLDRSVLANGSYYGLKTNVEQLHGTGLPVSADVKLCSTNTDYILGAFNGRKKQVYVWRMVSPVCVSLML